MSKKQFFQDSGSADRRNKANAGRSEGTSNESEGENRETGSEAGASGRAEDQGF
jgi:hypothetical protein